MDAQEKKIRIIQAAGHLFSTQGFHRTKMDDIAQNAQVAKGTLYYIFSSKSKLFAATVTQGLQEIMETIEEEIQSDLPFESHFKTLISAVVHSYIQNREITRIYANEMSSGIEPGVLDEIKAEREKFIDFIKNLLRYGEDQGYLKPLPHKLSALAIVSLMDALCTHYLENPKATCPDEIVETAYALLSSGLFAPGTPI